MSGEISSIAINVTICGLAIVFGTLIALVFIIWGFGKIMDGLNKPKTAKPAPAPASVKAASAPAAAPALSVSTASADDDEIIAVISAAVAAMYEGSGKIAVIRNVRPAATAGRPAWAAAGIAQNIKAF